MESGAPAVITSAGLNGGISRYLWHNFTGFTMAYIRGPAERISPRGTHICPTETFVIPRLRPARWSSRSLLLSLSLSPSLRRIPRATPSVFVHLVSKENDARGVFDTAIKVTRVPRVQLRRPREIKPTATDPPLLWTLM